MALPRLRGPEIAGLPHDDDYFVPVDRFGRVSGIDDVWAVGDMTARSLEQGGLATQQADVAASDIAARFGASIEVEPYRPVLEGLLLTGAEPEHLQRSSRSESRAAVAATAVAPRKRSAAATWRPTSRNSSIARDHAVRRRSVSAPSASAATVAATMTAMSTAIHVPSGAGRVARASAS